MKETCKTIALTSLVVLSLWLSWTIWNGSPAVSVVTPVAIQNPAVRKPGITLAQLALPRRMVIASGGGRYGLVPPFSSLYNHILDDLSGAYAEDYSVGPGKPSFLLSGNETGVALDFGMPLPVRVITAMTPIASSLDSQTQIREIAILTGNGGNAWGEAVTSDGQWITFQLSLSNRVVYGWLAQAARLPEYQAEHVANETYFVTEKPLPTSALTVRVQRVPVNDFTDSFFIDPTVTKKIEEEDGSVVFTDGSQGVRYAPGKNYVEYTNPSYSQGALVLSGQGFEKTVAFLNNHGGAPDRCLIVAGGDTGKLGLTEMTIRQYVNGLPVLGQVGGLELRFADQGVTSMVQFIEQAGPVVNARNVEVIPSAAVVATFLENRKTPPQSPLVDVFLSYLAEHQGPERLTLSPVWALELENHTLYLYDAVSGAFLQQTEAGLNGLG